MGDSAEKTPKTSFFGGVKSEFKKITWPDKKTMFKQAVAVVGISIVVGVIIAIIDWAALQGVDFITTL